MKAPLGQHFLRSKAALQALATALTLPEGVVIVEIGPGKGALTEYLLRHGIPVVAVEKDARLAEVVRNRFAKAIQNGSLTVLVGDIRDDFWLSTVAKPYVVIANIPYYLTGSLLRTLLSSDRQPVSLAVLVAKAVADRVVARDGKESLLSLSVQFFGTPKVIKTVPPSAFTPPPAISSAILTVTDIGKPPQGVQDAFFSLITTAFREKRKQVGKKFVDQPEVLHLFAKHGVSDTDRAEAIPFSVWYAVAQSLAATA